MGCGSSSQSEAEPQKPRLLVERAESVDRHGNGSVPSARKNGGIVNNNVPKTALTDLRAVEDEELHISVRHLFNLKKTKQLTFQISVIDLSYIITIGGL